jgi:hypothetical protein
VVVAVEQEHELVAGLAESLAVLAQHLGDLD